MFYLHGYVLQSIKSLESVGALGLTGFIASVRFSSHDIMLHYVPTIIHV